MDQLFQLAYKTIADANGGSVPNGPITRGHLNNIVAHNHLDQRQHDAQVVTAPFYRKAYEHQEVMRARQSKE